MAAVARSCGAVDIDISRSNLIGCREDDRAAIARCFACGLAKGVNRRFFLRLRV